METKPIEMTKAELWRQLEEVQRKMDEAIAERDAALTRVADLEAVVEMLARTALGLHVEARS